MATCSGEQGLWGTWTMMVWSSALHGPNSNNSSRAPHKGRPGEGREVVEEEHWTQQRWQQEEAVSAA